nr:hypothetical protein [Xylella fastidiosa]
MVLEINTNLRIERPLPDLTPDTASKAFPTLREILRTTLVMAHASSGVLAHVLKPSDNTINDPTMLPTQSSATGGRNSQPRINA